MIFAPDVDTALVTAAALVNADSEVRRDQVEALASVEDVERFYHEHRYSGRLDGTLAEVRELQAVRPQVRRLWELCEAVVAARAAHDHSAPAVVAAETALVDEINRVLQECHALPRLVRHDGWDWHLHATDPDEKFAVRVRAEVAMALVDVVRRGEEDRLHGCAGPDCTALVVDLSRNRSRRFCDVNNCADRANSAAYRARKAGAQE